MDFEDLSSGGFKGDMVGVGGGDSVVMLAGAVAGEIGGAHHPLSASPI